MHANISYIFNNLFIQMKSLFLLASLFGQIGALRGENSPFFRLFLLTEDGLQARLSGYLLCAPHLITAAEA